MAQLLGIVSTHYHNHQHIDPAHISEEQKAQYAEDLQRWSDGLREAEIGGEDEGWVARGQRHGVDVSYKFFEETSFIMVRGQINVEIKIEEVEAMMSYIDTTEKLRLDFENVDPMHIDSWIGGRYNETEDQLVQIFYAAFASGPLMPREFLFLNKVASREDLDDQGVNRRAIFMTVGSVDREEFGNNEQTLKRLRGQILSSGYAFRETEDPNVLHGTYVIQVDPKGSIPASIFNIIAMDQATNIFRMKERLEDLKRAHEVLNLPIVSTQGTRVGPRGHKEATFYCDLEENKDYALSTYSKDGHQVQITATFRVEQQPSWTATDFPLEGGEEQDGGLASNTRTKWTVTNGEASLDYIDVSDLEEEGSVLAVRVRFWNGNLMHSKCIYGKLEACEDEEKKG